MSMSLVIPTHPGGMVNVGEGCLGAKAFDPPFLEYHDALQENGQWSGTFSHLIIDYQSCEASLL